VIWFALVVGISVGVAARFGAQAAYFAELLGPKHGQAIGIRVLERSRQLLEQRVGFFQVLGVKAFSEPTIDRGERLTRGVTLIALGQ
jgi:hypothetical protein